MSQGKMGRYAGANLHKVGAMLRRTKRLAQTVELSAAAKRRLQWIDWYHAHGENARRTCRHCGLCSETFYR